MKTSLYTILFLLTMTAGQALGQIKVIDAVEEEIAVIYSGLSNEIRASRLVDGRFRILFRDMEEKVDDYGEIMLASEEEFQQLYDIIVQGYQDIKKSPVSVDLGNSILSLHYYPANLFGTSGMRMIVTDKTFRNYRKVSTMVWIKEINKLFRK